MKVKPSTQQGQVDDYDDEQEVSANDATRSETSNGRNGPYLNPFGLLKEQIITMVG